jgi:hypothetical protein
MTLAELSKLSPERKRTLLAEYDGFKDIHFGISKHPTRQKRDSVWEGRLQHNSDWDWYELPDYLISLDAIHRLIMAQSERIRKAIRFWLYELTDQMSAHFASAHNYCDAFLLTLC